MPHSADCPEGRSQHFTLPTRRGLLQGLAAVALPFLVSHSQPRSLYPSPEFKMGDLVAYDWEPDDDDAPEFATDFGEIMGMRWVPEPDGYCSVVNTWLYFVKWTHSSCPGILCEPQYDGEPTLASDLRLVNHA